MAKPPNNNPTPSAAAGNTENGCFSLPANSAPERRNNPQKGWRMIKKSSN
jgi:hypothetical protein